MILIRPMEEKDLPSAGEITLSSIGKSWDTQMLKKDFENQQSGYLTAEEDGKILGVIGWWQILDEGDVMVVAVDPESRNRGIGRKLVDAMFAFGEKKGILYWTLEVRKGNAPAIHLYEKAGFQKAGVRPKYYTDPVEDAVIYWKQ